MMPSGRSLRPGRIFVGSLPRLLLALFTGLPLLWLAGAALGALAQGRNGLAASMLPIALEETLTLMLWVGGGTALLGLVAAWLVTYFDFPFRRAFDWALVLPLAIPTYLAAYSYVEFLDFTGPVQQGLRVLIGATTLRDYWFPNIRSNGGAAMVMTLVLYPYVYVSCRAFFLMQSGAMASAARALGANGYRTFFAIILPLSRPALVVGVTLALMEVLNDLGAVQYFGVNSLTAVIYATWINRSDFGGAAQLAVTIVAIVLLLLLLEQWARAQRNYLGRRDARTPPPLERLTGAKAVLATAFCALLLSAGFGVPVLQFLGPSLRTISQSSVLSVLAATITTVALAAAGAVCTVVVGFMAARLHGGMGASRGAVRLATLGYAIPGTVLGLGLLQALGAADRGLNAATRLAGWTPGLILSGTVLAVLYAYAIRFTAVSHSTLDAAMRRRGRSVLDAGQVLGSRGWDLLFRIDLPTLSPALLSAATLVFVEIIKELPATLLLRPLGVETLATLTYAKANAGLFAEAALPGLAIVAAGLFPVILSARLSGRRLLPAPGPAALAGAQ